MIHPIDQQVIDLRRFTVDLDAKVMDDGMVGAVAVVVVEVVRGIALSLDALFQRRECLANVLFLPRIEHR